MKSTWKKRILSILLAVIMVCGAVPLFSVPSFAAATHTLNSHTYDGRYLQVTLTQTKDPANRRSKITGTVKSLGGNSTWYMTGPTTVKVAGTQRYSRALETSGNGQSNKNFTGTIPEFYVSHDTNGNASVSVEITTSIYYYASQTKSNTWTLDSIGPPTYTVTLDRQGGSGGSSSVMVTYNANMPSMGAIPTRTGYTFAGYYDATSGGTQYYTASGASARTWNKTSAATLYARWTANTYTVAYNGNGNTGGSTANSSHTYGTARALTSNGFSRTGYTFAGWATSASGSVAYSDAQSVSNLSSTNGATVTLYAKWTANPYSVSYNSNKPSTASTAISGTMTNSSHTYDTAKNLTTNAFSLPGYAFQGWATSAAGAVTYANSASVNNLTATNGATYPLYAKWDANTYVATFDKQQGTGGSNSVTVTFDANMPSATMPTRTGHTFKGYYDAASGGTQYYIATGASARTWNKQNTATLYAQWTANTYSVSFDKNAADATGSMSNQTGFTYDISKVLSANQFSRFGYYFSGWATTPTGNANYSNEQTVLNLTSDNGTTVPLYAVWTASPLWTVSFDANGGTGAPSAIQAPESNPGTALPATEPSRDNHQFLGWATSPTATVAQYQPSQSLTLAGNLPLFAVWKPLVASYKIETYLQNADGSYPITASSTSNHTEFTGTSVSAFPAPSIPDYAFDPSNAQHITNGVVAADGSLVLRLFYARDTYTLTVNPNNGGANSNFTARWGETVTPPIPEKLGYEFAGWQTLSGGAISSTDSVEVGKANATVIAQWNPIRDINYTIQYYYQATNGSYPSVAGDTEHFKDGVTDDTKTISPAATRNSYVFDSGNGQNKLSQTILSDGSTTYKVYYKRPTTTVTTDDGQVLSGLWGVAVTPVRPTKSGYSFASWDIVSGDAQTQGNNILLGSVNSQAVANWTANNYTVTFNANGGQGTMAAQQFTFDVEKALSKCTFTKADSRIVGWVLAENRALPGYGIDFLDQHVFTPWELLNNLSLYAVWEMDTQILEARIPGSGDFVDPFLIEYLPGAQLDGVQLNVDEITDDGKKYDILGFDPYTPVFDINLTRNGQPVQPATKVIVRIPDPFLDDVTPQIFRVSDDGKTRENMNAKRVIYNGIRYLEFETDHFSYYALVGDTSVHLNKSNTQLTYRGSEKLTATTTGDTRVTWSSSNTSVVTVDQNGNVQSVKKFGFSKGGTATITAKCGDKSAICVVTVKANFWQWLLIFLLFGWIWY